MITDSISTVNVLKSLFQTEEIDLQVIELGLSIKDEMHKFFNGLTYEELDAYDDFPGLPYIDEMNIVDALYARQVRENQVVDQMMQKFITQMKREVI